MQKFKKAVTLILATMMTLSLAACGGGDAKTDAGTNKEVSEDAGKADAGTTEPKVLRMAAQDPQVPLDPQKHTYSHLLKISDQILESLLILEDDGSIAPKLLTEMPVLQDDQLTYKFTLKEGVKFHNGETLKASDVKYSYVRLLSEGKMANLIDLIVGADKVVSGETTELEGFKIIDDTHFDITLNEVFVPFLSAIATDYVVIYPEQACKDAGDSWGLTTLVGTGPFKLKAYNQGLEAVLVKNTEYHGIEAKLDEIDFKFIQDPNTQVMEYQKGNIDVLQLDAALYPTFANNDAIKADIHTYTPFGLVFLTMNNKIIKDVKVREALSYSIDRDAICKDLMYGTATPATTFIPKGLLGYNADAPAFEYNPEKAKKLLAEAGYPDGIELEAQDNSKYPTYSNVIIAIQDQAKASGINIKINKVDNAAWADMKRSGQVTMAISNWYVDYADPDGMLYQTMSEKLTKQNSNFYAGSEFNELLNKARSTTDEAEREKMYKQADEILTRKDFAAIPVFNETMFYLVKDYVKGFEVNANNRYIYATTDIQK